MSAAPMIWPMVAAPLLGALVLALVGRRLDRRLVGTIACAAVAVSLLAAIVASGPLFNAGLEGVAAAPGATGPARTDAGAPYAVETLWSWLEIGTISIDLTFRLDPLSALMALVISGVGLLIHVYAAGYMAEDREVGRFFATMNLFVAAMLALVLADDLVLLYLGWEGVGACSFLLIGFWNRDPANGTAARKAFVVTRVGDAALAIGLFLLATELSTLRIPAVMEEAGRRWSVGDPTVTLAATLLMIGALGKSAQIPLQVWLPDAMAGPTPVSALIHAATMVTAGVYLIARTHELFLLAPAVMSAIATIGVFTAFVAACSALVQVDIKRVLAYSTISQVGFMFAALGAGAFTAAIFHFVTHAFFKALLFLSAGIVTHACDGESDIRRMGALRRSVALPGAATVAAVGAAALAGVPLITAGFYSKDAILWGVVQPPYGGPWLLAGLLLTAGLTAVYSFRWYFMIFSGPAGPVSERELHRPGMLLLWPCAGLAAGAIFTGFLEMPESLGGYHGLGEFLDPVFATAGGIEPALVFGNEDAAHRAELMLQLVSGGLALLGILMAYHWFVLKAAWVRRLAASAPGRLVHEIWRAGWGIDAAYELLFVRPFRTFSSWLRDEPVDDLLGLATGTAGLAHRVLALTQSGRVRTYAAGLLAGALLLLLGWLWGTP